MNENEKEMLEFVQFVTDKFSTNHEPWKFTEEHKDLVHIRYTGDYTGYNHWTKRVKRFLRDITINWIRPTDLRKALGIARINWFSQVAISWKIQIQKDKNLPDGTVNGIITHWAEDGEYITMFGPTVGREVLKFLNADPNNMYARKIINAMMEAQEASWPSEKEETS